MENMYRHQIVNDMTNNARKVISGLFDFYMSSPNQLPQDQRALAKKITDKKQLAILISDYIAGMTDRFAIREFENIKS
jgi:dGTPase